MGKHETWGRQWGQCRGWSPDDAWGAVGGAIDPPFAAPALCTHTHTDSPTDRRAPGPPPRVQPPGALAPAGTVTAGHAETHLPGAQALAHNTHGHSAQGPGAEGRCGGRGPGREQGRRRARGLMPALFCSPRMPPRRGSGLERTSVKEGAGSARTAPLPGQRPARLARPAPAFPRPAASGKEFWGRPPSSSIPHMGRGVPAACGSASVSPPEGAHLHGCLPVGAELRLGDRRPFEGAPGADGPMLCLASAEQPLPGGDVHPATPRAVPAGSLQLLQPL